MSFSATATAGSVVTEIAWVPIPRISILYPVKFVLENVRFGTCFTRSGPPAVCVSVNCSCESAVIAIGTDCTSAPPSFDDVTVTVSTAACTGVACATSISGWFSERSSGTIVIPAVEWRRTTNPVPVKMRASASSEENSPFAPFVEIPRTASPDTINGTPVCFAYAVRADFRSPAGILNSSACNAVVMAATDAKPNSPDVKRFSIGSPDILVSDEEEFCHQIARHAGRRRPLRQPGQAQDRWREMCQRGLDAL